MARFWRRGFDGVIKSRRASKMTATEDLSAVSCDGERSSFAAQDFQIALVGMMGHDFRQSLQIIQSSYALLRSRPEGLPEEALLSRGERAVRELAEQMDCMVGAFYLAERADEIDVSSVPLARVFSRLRQENEDAAIQRGIDLRILATETRVFSHPLLLNCILRNLMTNAIQYTEPGGRILIGCRRKGPEVRIDVHDTGMGIPADQLPRIFGAFTRLSPERSNGLGIGLSIVRRAINALGHRIEVRSGTRGGCLFSIYLPVAPALNKS
jgi:two-component system, OmpR family, phosphate regulon sensor histidine kinase PhoR